LGSEWLRARIREELHSIPDRSRIARTFRGVDRKCSNGRFVGRRCYIRRLVAAVLLK
jgi:hypothetical protein